jgi:hypothetical protein
VLATLVETRASLQNQLRDSEVLADSLTAAIARAKIDIEELKLRREYDLAGDRLAAHQKLGELRLERRYGLELEAADLNNQVREARVQLNMLSPLERVGRITVSDKPARPRKLRAISILTALGLFGGLVLAFAWDYVDRHRYEIFRS